MKPMRRDGLARARLIAVALVAACSAKPPPVAPEVEPGSPEVAEKEIRSLLSEAYQSLKRNNAPGMMSLLAADVFVAGPRHGDVGLERSAALVTLGEAISSKKAHKLRSTKLEYGAAPDGRSAWAVDHIELDGKPFVITAIAAELDGLWALTTVHVARPSKDAEPAAALAPAWSPDEGATSAHRAAHPEAAQVLAQLTGAPDLRVDYLDAYADRQSMVVRAGPRSALRGAKAIKKAWKKKPPVWTVGPAIAAAMSPDGTFAWLLAPAALDGEAPGTRRLFMVVERVPDDEAAGSDETGETLPWRLVVLHETAPTK
jgi:hypothetical protein